MNTSTIAVARTFFANLRNAGTPLPRFTLDGSVEDLLVSVPSGREAKADEADAIRFVTGSYSVGEPHGTQLDLARHAARVALDPSFAEVEVRVEQIAKDLTAVEREMLRRWRNYERRAIIARHQLRDLNAEILELTESGGTPDSETLTQRSALIEQVEHWGRKSQNPIEFPLEVDQWAADAADEVEDLEILIASQKADQREWARRSR